MANLWGPALPPRKRLTRTDSTTAVWGRPSPEGQSAEHRASPRQTFTEQASSSSWQTFAEHGASQTIAGLRASPSQVFAEQASSSSTSQTITELGASQTTEREAQQQVRPPPPPPPQVVEWEAFQQQVRPPPPPPPQVVQWEALQQQVRPPPPPPPQVVQREALQQQEANAQRQPPLPVVPPGTAAVARALAESSSSEDESSNNLEHALAGIIPCGSPGREDIEVVRVVGFRCRRHYYGVYLVIVCQRQMFGGHISLLHCGQSRRLLTPAQIRQLERGAADWPGKRIVLAGDFWKEYRHGRFHRACCLIDVRTPFNRSVWALRQRLSAWLPANARLEGRINYHLSFDYNI